MTNRYWWNGKMQTIAEIAAIENVGYQSAYKYLQRGYSSSNDVNHKRGIVANNFDASQTKSYDNFIDEMLSWQDSD